jgi:hypothetical protein
MATVVFINRLQPADGKRDALIGLLREFAESINLDARPSARRCRHRMFMSSNTAATEPAIGVILNRDQSYGKDC